MDWIGGDGDRFCGAVEISFWGKRAWEWAHAWQRCYREEWDVILFYEEMRSRDRDGVKVEQS